ESGTAPGCLVPARLLGAVEAEERKKKNGGNGKTVRNDRLLAVPAGSRRYAQLKSLEQLPEALREQIEHFLVSYGALEGKGTKIIGLRGPDEARMLVKEAAGRK
ncbi:MAG: inorganic diphosphatase, partial [Actinomycetota bacterium]